MNSEIIVIGAGAAGLMAARELAKAGKKVIVLEARDRIGGRILPLDEAKLGFPAQGGAEWVHGEAPITKALAKEIGLTLIPDEGEVWSTRSGELAPYESFIREHPQLKEKLAALKEDIPIAEFLEKNFSAESDSYFKNSVLQMVQGYEAADPQKMSTFALRESWLGKKDKWDDHRIKEGYGPLIDFLKNECEKYGAKIHLNIEVCGVELLLSHLKIHIKSGEAFESEKVIVTVPLPVLKDIDFNSELQEKKDLIPNIGFGHVIKVIINFKIRWWEHVQGKDLSKMSFLTCNEKFLTWWTQYPLINNVLVGWMAGPEAEKHAHKSNEELLDLALESISRVCGFDLNNLKKEILHSEVFNWSGDKFTRGAYSYTTYTMGDTRERLALPFGDKIFFAGEALFSGDGTATVEGALGSGLETAQKILSLPHHEK